MFEFMGFTHIYFSPHLANIVAIESQPSIEVLDSSLGSFIIALTGIKTVTVLVDRVVGQMNELLLL